MKVHNPDATICLWIIIFLHKIAEIISVAPSVPDLYATSRYSETNITGRMLVDLLTNCPTKCHCNTLVHKMIVDCSGRQLQNFPTKIHASTFDLQLFNNRLTVLTYDTSLENLEILNASRNSITMLDNVWFETLTNLHTLDISWNRLQSEGIEDIFYRLSLQCLNLSHNSLKAVTTGMFNNMKSLRDLNLSGNAIDTIDFNSFSMLSSLEKLDLSSNRLIQIKHEWFRNLKKLKVLFLEKNNLQLLSNVVFWPLNELELLDLSQNRIGSLGLLTFKGLLNLKSLNVSHNNILSLPEGVFRSLEQIKVLDLSHNPLQSFDKSFKHVTSLETLYLKYLRNLTTLTSSSLLGLNHVEVIDLSGSKQFSNINQFAFSSTRNLRTLDISNSNISSLKRGVFKDLANLESIKLRGNPWRCNCYLYWLLLWLGENGNTHILSPSETVCKTPSKLEDHVLLDALDHDMVCTNASIYKYTKNAHFRVASAALLQCQAKGNPSPTITWITPLGLKFYWTLPQNNTNLNQDYSDALVTTIEVTTDDEVNEDDRERFALMKNGDLLIRNVERGDGGFYMCVATNPLANHSIAIRLTLDYEYLTHIKIISILVGLATSFGFLLLTLISVLIKMILDRCGIKCHCKSGKTSPKSQQIRKILESMEHYKKQQLERLRENYNSQVQRIKDNCMQQMERLRESYSSQAERLRDIRDYGTLQIDRIRENYYSQVQRVRDYSACQIERLRENYLFQRSRIRKFSAHHLYKLRENYKLQQQHLNKILENLNIESCRNVCQRTDSIVFEPDITLENVFVPKICLSQSFPKSNCDSIDNSSQMSAYFTPEEAGSELSEHEGDALDSSLCINVNDILDYHPYNEIPTTTPDFLKESSTDIQPDVAIFSNSELCINTNETIV